MSNQYQRVGIVGAGAIAHGLTALLETSHHIVTLWSPSGRTLADIVTTKGAIETKIIPKVATNAQELAANSDIIIFALPVNGHKPTMDEIAPYLQSSHHIIISSYASFSAQYLEKVLLAREVEIPITVWSTTAITAKLPQPDRLNINVIRKKIDVATIPKERSQEALARCKKLFMSEFIEKDSLLEIILSNVNPELHMGMALCNITRMEQAEEWSQRKNVTPTVGRLIEALDEERLAIAAAFDCSVKSIFDHYNMEGDNSVSDINQVLHAKKPVMGPKTADSRYVLEDVPYGLFVTSQLGEYIGVPTPLHTSGVHLFSALYGRDFSNENTLLETLAMHSLTQAEISR